MVFNEAGAIRNAGSGVAGVALGCCSKCGLHRGGRRISMGAKCDSCTAHWVKETEVVKMGAECPATYGVRHNQIVVFAPKTADLK